MTKTYISHSECPFQAKDRVRCDHTNIEAMVVRIEDENVFVVSDNGTRFYRTWTHELDTIMHKSGGGLTRIERPTDDNTGSV